MNLSEAATEESQQRPIPKTGVLLMFIIVVSLAILAVFANVERFRRGDVQVVNVKSARLPTPQGTKR